jgi:hypothetical protein
LSQVTPSLKEREAEGEGRTVLNTYGFLFDANLSPSFHFDDILVDICIILLIPGLLKKIGSDACLFKLDGIVEIVFYHDLYSQILTQRRLADSIFGEMIGKYNVVKNSRKVYIDPLPGDLFECIRSGRNDIEYISLLFEFYKLFLGPENGDGIGSFCGEIITKSMLGIFLICDVFGHMIDIIVGNIFSRDRDIVEVIVVEFQDSIYGFGQYFIHIYADYFLFHAVVFKVK